MEILRFFGIKKAASLDGSQHYGENSKLNGGACFERRTFSPVMLQCSRENEFDAILVSQVMSDFNSI
ncbi:MAG: hypothetical protein HQL85_19150 [Magnetococcales bacterium]|nr:hypothetical protein [Magnetococcales bacterium]